MSGPKNNSKIKQLLNRIAKTINPKRVLDTIEVVKEYKGLKRIAGQLLLLSIIAIGGWAAYSGLTSFPSIEDPVEGTIQPSIETQPATTKQVNIADLASFAGGGAQDILVERRIDVHTVFPSRPRL